MQYIFLKNDSLKRFEVTIQNSTAYTEFYMMSEKICLTHTLVPDELTGKGIGKLLVENILNFAKDNRLEIYPFCPFISSYIKKNEQWMPFVSKGFKWN
ncbi:GNAT family N-acetyltransferase [Flavobacterium oreochromis]|uniref:GNAT family N-acetyltransferase n=1 Tax=Flavobacterium oreochromis TaxID=2906078 RepID=UPI000CDA58E1|nr:GNAT family N-acetyltransferase [Flavobacterium oreochromis]POR24042.1 hypothetical protein BWK58_08900 [Flavobacterium columnare]QYS86207.1 N-acetyltransferase [Flavobacterium oreochromis]